MLGRWDPKRSRSLSLSEMVPELYIYEKGFESYKKEDECFADNLLVLFLFKI